MHFKLLNFHKFIGNFATSLVGTFIPLIIYKVTGSLRLAVLFLFGQCLCRLISNHLFKNFVSKYPQVALMIRVVPLLIYNLALIFLDEFMVFGIIIIIISYGISLSLKNNAYGVLLNYSSRKKTSKNIALTRIVESFSAIIACVAGGLFIDWNQTILIIFSISLYFVSVIPLFVFFIINKNKVGFNKDFTSNAAEEYDKNPILKEKRKKMVKGFALQFFIFYALFCVVDPFTNMYTLHNFISQPTFAKAGYITAMFYVAHLTGILLIDLLKKKFDLKTTNTIFGFICAIPLVIIPFLQSYVSIYLLVFIFGLSYSICSYFMMDSLMTKCKIINATNISLVARQDGIMVGQMTASLVVFLFNKVLPVFFVMSFALIIYAIYTNFKEEKLRNKLVDYLEDNEIEN